MSDLLCAMTGYLFSDHNHIGRHLTSDLLHYSSTTFSSKILIEIVENCAGPLEPHVVIFIGHGDPSDQPLDANSILTLEFCILEVDVMNDLCDGSERRVVESHPFDQNFQSAPITLMREFRFKHVKPHLIRHRFVAFCRNKLEARLWIDET